MLLTRLGVDKVKPKPWLSLPVRLAKEQCWTVPQCHWPSLHADGTLGHLLIGYFRASVITISDVLLENENSSNQVVLLKSQALMISTRP